MTVLQQIYIVKKKTFVSNMLGQRSKMLKNYFPTVTRENDPISWGH